MDPRPRPHAGGTCRGTTRTDLSRGDASESGERASRARACRQAARRNAFPLLVAVLLCTTIGAYRVASGSGFGLRSIGADPTASGMLFGQLDNLSYASWAQQARHGAWRLQNLYTTEPHRRIYVNPYFVAVGKLARVSGLEPFGVMVLLGIGASAALVVLAHALARVAGFGVPAARWACLLAAFSSGLSWPVQRLGAALGREPIAGADLLYQDAILFSSAFVYPYHAFAAAWTAAALYVATTCLRCDRRPSRGRWTFLAALTALAPFVHPYEPIMLCASFVGACLLQALTGQRGAPLRQLERVALLLSLASAPGLVGSTWLGSQPVWSWFARTATGLAQPPLFWILGYGAVLPLSVVGCLVAIRSRKPEALPLVAWVLLLWILLLVVTTPLTRLCNGGHLALCVLAGAGIAAAWSRASRLEAAPGLVARLGICGLVALCFATSLHLLTGVYRALPYDAQLAALGDVVRRIAPGGSPTVLCNVTHGAALPGMYGLRVFAGHWALTPEGADKVRTLERAGFEPTRDGSPIPLRDRRDALAALLQQTDARFAIVERHAPAAGLLPGFPRARELARAGELVLFELRR